MTQLAMRLGEKKARYKVAVDFDGTIVESQYPHVGEPVPFALWWMKRFLQLDAEVNLWTVRTDDGKDGEMLKAAIEYCRANGVEFTAVNTSKGQRHWSSSPKSHADVYIDDAAFGCPLLPAKEYHGARPYADWRLIGPFVEAKLIERLQLRGEPIPHRDGEPV